MWKDFFPALDAIVFIVDASDTQRLLESKHELDSLLNDEQLAQCPVVVNILILVILALQMNHLLKKVAKKKLFCNRELHLHNNYKM